MLLSLLLSLTAFASTDSLDGNDFSNAELSFIAESLNTSDYNSETSLVNCTKAKTARYLCLGSATTDSGRMSCNAIYCSTIRNHCNSIPQDCIKK